MKIEQSGSRKKRFYFLSNWSIKKNFRNPQKAQVGTVLIQKGLISREQLNQALAAQRGSDLKLGEVLLQKGLITSAQLQQVLLEQRWRNLVATVFLSASTLVTGFSGVHLPHPEKSQGRQAGKNPVKSPNHGIGGTNPVDRSGRWSQRTQGTHASRSIHYSPSQPNNAPLNRKPTVASPLRGFCHPLKGKGFLSQGIQSGTHQGRSEYAYDLAVPIGSPVYTMKRGRVVDQEDRYPDTGGGRNNSDKFNYVMIEHDDGYRSAYIHLQQGFRPKVNLQPGAWVEAGQMIGYSGNSGWSTGPHLHVEVQKPGARSRFTKTVPFAVSSTCSSGKVSTLSS